MRKLICLFTYLSLTIPCNADETIHRSGAAVSFFGPGYEAHHLESIYSDGIVLGENLAESQAVYEFYVPGNEQTLQLLSSVTVFIFGSGDITNFIVHNSILGPISDNYSVTLTGADIYPLGTALDPVNGDVLRVYVYVTDTLDRYDLEKIEFTYTYTDADSGALENYHTAYSGYNAIHGWRTEVVDETWGIENSNGDEILKAALQETGSLCQNLLDFDGNIFNATRGFLGSLDNFYGLADLIYDQLDWILFWGSYPTTGPTINEVKTACNEAATACADLAVAYQEHAFDGIDTNEEASAVLTAIQEAETKLNTLKSRLQSAAQDMHDVYSGGNNQAKLAKQSMEPLMMYDPCSMTLYDSYLPNLISDVQAMGEDFVEITLNAYPSGKDLKIIADGIIYTAPEIIIWPSGQTLQIGTPSPQTGNDSKTYGFTHWSDAGTQSHSISPTSDVTITAYFDTTPIAPSNFSHSDITNDSITWTWQDNSGDEDGFRGHDSSHNVKWTVPSNITSKTESGLSANTEYTRHVHAYNWVGNCGPSNNHSAYTKANSPGSGLFSNINCTAIQANWTANGNPAGTTEYYCENISNGTNSGWTTDTYWYCTGLSRVTTHSFRVKARNFNGIETGWTNLGSETTHYEPVISMITPDSGPMGTCMKIKGQYFYDFGEVLFTGGGSAEILQWNNTNIYCRVPQGAFSGNVVVNRGLDSNSKYFTLTDPNTILVDLTNSSGIENGTPTYPFTKIQYGIDAATGHDEVIIAEGTYTGYGNRNIDFLGKAITVRSGDPNDPDVAATTIIDCQGLGRGFHFHCGEDQESVLAGLKIYNGNAYNGGGILCGSSPTIRNCTFIGNSAEWGGGISSCGDSTPIIINCTFSGNSADDGGACSFEGGLATLINCTFSENGPFYVFFVNGDLELVNCILWDNCAWEEISIYGSPSDVSISYSNIKGGRYNIFPFDDLNWGDGNIDTDPLFSDADGPDNVAGTEDDNLRLLPGSPCIDAGDNYAVPEGITKDLDGNLRFFDDPNTADTGNGIPPIVDMGAYEFGGVCGDINHPYPIGDVNIDCVVDTSAL